MRKLLTIAAIAIAMLFPRPLGASTMTAQVMAPTSMRFVLKTNPKLTLEEGWWISYLIDLVAREHDLDPKLFAAIIAQESAFKRRAKRCDDGKKRNCDFGLGQINVQWVRKWKLDKKRLLTDPEYNLRIAARLLRDALDSYGDREPKNAYSRYHNPAKKFRVAYEAHIQKRLAFF